MEYSWKRRNTDVPGGSVDSTTGGLAKEELGFSNLAFLKKEGTLKKLAHFYKTAEGNGEFLL